ncbi:MAG: IS5 family transposase [Candidatus Zeuxoniibacter abyssi]|nr:MAG: IS5 family transposase [Candidatus Persebacteraceae bacterium AB1(2)]
MAKKQPSFSDLDYDNKKKTTRKDLFLQKMNEVIPWEVLLKPIRWEYPQGALGRPPIALGKMLRIYFMQQWYHLGDPAMEDMLYDSASMKRFVGISIDEVPDETTLCKFRHFLESHKLTECLFSLSRSYLEEQGLLLREGTIVDASIIEAPSSTKNRAGKRDSEMRQTKKGNQWHFGMKLHIGTDTGGGVHTVVVTDASVHDSCVMEDLLHGDERVIYGDKGYVSEERREAAERSGKTWRVSRRSNRGRKLNAADKAFNRKSNRIRSRVEHVFGVIKNLWGYRKVRYKGLEKNRAQVLSLLALANFYRYRHKLA